jgi:hypothetical protein
VGQKNYLLYLLCLLEGCALPSYQSLIRGAQRTDTNMLRSSSRNSAAFSSLRLRGETLRTEHNQSCLWSCCITTDVTTIDALKLVAKVVFCEVFQSSRRKYRGTGMFKTVSKPLAHLNFLSGVNCYDIGSTTN